MKTKALVLALLMLLVLPACRTIGPDGLPVYDPVKSAQVTDAFTLIGRETISRIIRNSPKHRESSGVYFRAIGTVFCRIKETGQFTPDSVLTEIDRVTGPLQQGVDPLLITTKNALWTLFKVFVDQKLTAELPPDRWPAHVSKVACDAIHGALVDNDLPGVYADP